EFGGRVFIAAHMIGYRFGPFVHHPGESVAEKEPLVGIQSCNNFMILVLASLLKRLVSHHDAAEVGNIFSLRKFAVDMQTVDGNVIAKLFYDHFCFGVEFGAVFRSPPIVQIAKLIILASLVIEPVSNLMAEGRTADDGI